MNNRQAHTAVWVGVLGGLVLSLQKMHAFHFSTWQQTQKHTTHLSLDKQGMCLDAVTLANVLIKSSWNKIVIPNQKGTEAQNNQRNQ